MKPVTVLRFLESRRVSLRFCFFGFAVNFSGFIFRKNKQKSKKEKKKKGDAQEINSCVKTETSFFLVTTKLVRCSYKH